MTQDDVPKVNSINLTPPGADELDWDSTLMHFINKSEDGQVTIPAHYYEELEPHMKYVVASFVYEN